MADKKEERVPLTRDSKKSMFTQSFYRYLLGFTVLIALSFGVLVVFGLAG